MASLAQGAFRSDRMLLQLCIMLARVGAARAGLNNGAYMAYNKPAVVLILRNEDCQLINLWKSNSSI